MNEMRKKIIIKEILYWKNSRMLPDQYCEYLLALYSEGEEINQPYAKPGKRRLGLPYLIIGAIISITLVLNYFTQLPYGMQISSSIFSIFALLIITAYFSKRLMSYHIPLIGAVLLFLLATVSSVEHFAPGRVGVLYFFLLCHAGLWIYLGKRLGMAYFTVAGYLGTGLIAFFLAKLYVGY
ncbi:hypothetical protein [Peribacillus glennii]|uniref:DUF2157 domain-containing protein n=1 Tax=Peribacillus glennii TaxID=2303991 RepID=A0A372LJE9_9BACI|nr:hypothetical protein [Peribacillus glennii]RFU65736.1 hypothetical protein D0466_07650 [Peribacillus glennii]